MSLQDKVVVIMGASSGIGAATAKLLASKGAKVTIAARRMNRLEEIKQANPDSDILAVEADVTKAKEVQNVVDQTVAKFGRVDALYNNAGIMPVNNLDQIAQDEWQNMLDINVKGVKSNHDDSRNHDSDDFAGILRWYRNFIGDWRSRGRQTRCA